MFGRTSRKILGPLIFALGVALAAWIACNLFVERVVSGSAIIAGINASVFIWVGWGWMRGEKVGAIRKPRA